MKNAIDVKDPRRSQLVRVTVDGWDVGVGILDSLERITWTNLDGEVTIFESFGEFVEEVRRSNIVRYDWRIAVKPVNSVLWNIVQEGDVE